MKKKDSQAMAYFLMLIFLMLTFLPMSVPSVKASDVNTMTLNVNGNINGVPFTASGIATVDNSVFPALVTNTVTYSNIPAGWHPMAWIITIINTWKCPGSGSAVNIDTVTGGNFGVSRTFTTKDWNDTTVGNGAMTADVTKLTPTSYAATVTVTGMYTGPTDPTSASGYITSLHQAASGEIAGSFVQTVSTPGGELQILANSMYTYTGGTTLPADEVSNLRIDSISFVGTTLSWTGAGWYEVPGVGGIVELPLIEEPGTAIPDSSGHNYGALAGIIAGAIAGTIALIGAVWYIRRRRTKAI